MNCIKCSGLTEVDDSRFSRDTVRRRRKCVDCSQRFTTYEMLSEDFFAFKLAKRDLRSVYSVLGKMAWIKEPEALQEPKPEAEYVLPPGFRPDGQ